LQIGGLSYGRSPAIDEVAEEEQEAAGHRAATGADVLRPDRSAGS
jgi:hypothetical protein